MDNVKPLGSLVLIRIDKEEEQTSAGIILAESSKKETPNTGVVESLGDEVLAVKVGDHVIFPRYGGNEIKIGDVPYNMCECDDILAVIG